MQQVLACMEAAVVVTSDVAKLVVFVTASIVVVMKTC